MTDINRVLLIGRLTRDAELKYTKGGTPVLNGAIAVGRSIPPASEGGEWKNETSFFDFQLFGRSAESAAKWALKGKQVGIDGALRQDRWEQDGQPRSRILVNCDRMQPLSDPKGAAGGGASPYNEPQGQDPAAAPRATKPAPARFPTATKDEIASFDDDIPF